MRMHTGIVVVPLALLGCAVEEAEPDGEGIVLADEAEDPEGDEAEEPERTADTSPPKPTTQSLFDFTVAADRAAFEAVDLAYVDSVGPYAIFEVTGPMPQLVGPPVLFDRDAAWTMLCASKEYFTADGEAVPIAIELYGGGDGAELLAALTLQPLGEEGCSQPDDEYGERPPPEIEADESRFELLRIDFDPVPAVGSRVLVRQAGLVDYAPGHNDSHVIPMMCCDSALGCTVEP